ncbi:MAG TPA: radical SAM protein [Spirochaetota bacterium]|nr:radical SAM protein [Spirochaetota bacterium]HOH37730.1 radical SAM protein [Spirochaetota bacterium]HPJ13460.1 radical SAM protein [Spirochaetota bacterium]HPM32979.1 radical SAM protein [Spirochaetota bacterium]HPY03898.1 radical SAM protein [Spirochaetota bacterium]
MKEFVKNVFLRCFCLSKEDSLSFTKYTGENVDYSKIDNLYIHIPFCKNLCPYCPYYKEKYSIEKADEFSKYLLKEISLHKNNLEGKNIDSLYIGGGSPSLLVNTLEKAIRLLKTYCCIKNIAIEVNPEDINNEILSSLRQMNCNLISIGIQDFHRNHLSAIGRNYNSETALAAIHSAKKSSFDTVNIDLIFALPGQTLSDLDHSLDLAISSNPDQITTYPLFTFPYSSVGKFNKINSVIFPNSLKRKKFYFYICEKLSNNGYQQISVWSFAKKGHIKYSSVTRNYFLGIGPSAATYNGKYFLFNFFDINSYQNQVKLKKNPYALVLKLSNKLEKLYWLYWKLYETKIPLQEYKRLFSSNLLSDFKLFFILIRIMGYAKIENEIIHISRKGIHRIHLLQNSFSLNFINKVWSDNYNNPNPKGTNLK